MERNKLENEIYELRRQTGQALWGEGVDVEHCLGLMRTIREIYQELKELTTNEEPVFIGS